MSRAPIVLAGTAAGLAGVLSFHPRTPEPVTAAAAATPGTSAAPAVTTTSPSAASGSSAARTATGKAVATPYGNAQVRVTVKAGKISRIEALQLQGNDPKSVQISTSAEPTLRQEALQAQSAAIDVVSGATYTSTSYEDSLQSALDKAGFEAADGSRGTATVPAAPAHGDHDDRGGFGGPDDGGGFPGGDQGALPSAP